MKKVAFSLLALLTGASLLLSQEQVAENRTGSEREQLQTTGKQLKGLSESDITLFGRLQSQGYIQSLNDRYGDNVRMYLYMKQARFGLRGTYDDIRVDFQVAFGGEEEVKAPSPGISLSLLDLSADIPLSQNLFLKVGQFKVPFGREGLTNSAYMQFSDRSLQYLASKVGRDVGFALWTTSGMYSATAGVFTGGGRNVPIRMIPQQLGLPMAAVRVGINTGIDAELYSLKSTDAGVLPTGYALFVNALYTKDSRIGHSTALNVKTADKSLLLNSNWNPYIGRRPFHRGSLLQLGADAALRTAVTPELSVSGEAELNYGSYKNYYGSLSTTAGRIQGAVAKGQFELGVRYAFIKPDQNFAVTASNGTTYKITESRLVHEIDLAVSYFVKGGRVKITADLPVLFGVPVITEPNVGAYVLTEQPDQVTYLLPPTNGVIERQTVVSPRLQVQVVF